ncbi:MAG: hypothetical protein DHS20C18_37880 [Saprospiraceae bacterium]|nr:MAG: hypothetical protein DHS20C18_37880 [Saprospiraceae bacterium]
MSQITMFDYEDQKISFEFSDGNKMINATEMAKPFKGKLVADFLRLKSTKEYIILLNERYGNSHIAHERETLQVIKGGDAAESLQGTKTRPQICCLAQSSF